METRPPYEGRTGRRHAHAAIALVAGKARGAYLMRGRPARVSLLFPHQDQRSGFLAILRKRLVVADDSRAFDFHLIAECLELAGVHIVQRSLPSPRLNPVECLLDLSVVSKALHSREEERPHSLIHRRVHDHIPQVVIDDFTDPLRPFGSASCPDSKTPVGYEKDQAYDERREDNGQDHPHPGIAQPGQWVHVFFALAHPARATLEASTAR